MACGVTPSGIMTSHMTRTPFLRAASGKTRIGLRTQSELRPSACMVELPSKPHRGRCSSEGKLSNSLIWVFPRRFGTGVYPSSQMYSSLYFVMRVSRELMTRGVDAVLIVLGRPTVRWSCRPKNPSIKYANQPSDANPPVGLGAPARGADFCTHVHRRRDSAKKFGTLRRSFSGSRNAASKAPSSARDMATKDAERELPIV